MPRATQTSSLQIKALSIIKATGSVSGEEEMEQCGALTLPTTQSSSLNKTRGARLSRGALSRTPTDKVGTARDNKRTRAALETESTKSVVAKPPHLQLSTVYKARSQDTEFHVKEMAKSPHLRLLTRRFQGREMPMFGTYKTRSRVFSMSKRDTGVARTQGKQI